VTLIATAPLLDGWSVFGGPYGSDVVPSGKKIVWTTAARTGLPMITSASRLAVVPGSGPAPDWFWLEPSTVRADDDARVVDVALDLLAGGDVECPRDDELLEVPLGGTAGRGMGVPFTCQMR
jgi:hypothetical protein